MQTFIFTGPLPRRRKSHIKINIIVLSLYKAIISEQKRVDGKRET